MKLNQLLLVAFLVLATAAPSLAQEDNGFSKETDFTLHRYTPEWVDAHSLANAIETLYGRDLEFEDRSVPNLTLLEDFLIIYETDSRLQRILHAISTLDESAEEEWMDEENQANRIDPNNMVIKSFQPTNLDYVEFYTLASELYERSILVGDDWHSNLRYAQNRGITIYEEAGEIDELLTRLTLLDESQEMEPNQPLVVVEYQPRFVSPKGLMDGIQSFEAMVMDTSHSDRVSVRNISLMRERGLFVIRDIPQRAQQIIATLERLDQPEPQTMMICQVIRGSNQQPKEGETRASDEVAAQLKQILPHQYYTVSGTGMLRAGVSSKTTLELFMDQANHANEQYRLEMNIGSYDPEGGSMNLDTCELSTKHRSNQTSHTLFQTSTTIYNGEYAVLGVTGAEPLFLVVQLLPIAKR